MQHKINSKVSAGDCIWCDAPLATMSLGATRRDSRPETAPPTGIARSLISHSWKHNQPTFSPIWPPCTRTVSGQGRNCRWHNFRPSMRRGSHLFTAKLHHFTGGGGSIIKCAEFTHEYFRQLLRFCTYVMPHISLLQLPGWHT